MSKPDDTLRERETADTDDEIHAEFLGVITNAYKRSGGMLDDVASAVAYWHGVRLRADRREAEKQGALNALYQLKTNYIAEWVGTNAAGALKKNPRSWGEMVDEHIEQLRTLDEGEIQS